MERTRIIRPVNRSLNEPVTLGGVDYRVLFGTFVVSAVVFLFLSKLGAGVVLFGLPVVARWVTRKDPRMFEVWSLSFQQRSHYDAGKRF